MANIFIVTIKDISPEGLRLKTQWGIQTTATLLEEVPTCAKVYSPLMLDFSFTLVQTDIILDGLLNVGLGMACARCLSEFTCPLDIRFRYLYRPESEQHNEPDKELNQDDLEIVYYTGEHIDLKPLVREQLYLNIPHYPHCSDNCRGLCPGCGVNLNKAACRCPSGSGNKESAFAVLGTLKKH